MDKSQDDGFWQWVTVEIWQELHAIECIVYLERRPGYCDRGTVYAKVECFGYPVNPKPIDWADGWPRYYSTEDVAKSEIAWWMERRSYTPADPKTIATRLAERA